MERSNALSIVFRWQMTPHTVNAYYSISSNEIVFPAGILQPPFFQKDLPSAINYGAIGSVIGHEMTHGFDNQGREFDADGNMHLWWTNSSLTKFEENSQCFIKQYSNFILNGQNENGQRTLGENIADNGGIKIAYFAYEKHRQHPSTNRLPGLDYTSDQLFFIAFAHVNSFSFLSKVFSFVFSRRFGVISKQRIPCIMIRSMILIPLIVFE